MCLKIFMILFFSSWEASILIWVWSFCSHRSCVWWAGKKCHSSVTSGESLSHSVADIKMAHLALKFLYGYTNHFSNICMRLSLSLFLHRIPSSKPFMPFYHSSQQSVTVFHLSCPWLLSWVSLTHSQSRSPLWLAKSRASPRPATC